MRTFVDLDEAVRQVVFRCDFSHCRDQIVTGFRSERHRNRFRAELSTQFETLAMEHRRKKAASSTATTMDGVQSHDASTDEESEPHEHVLENINEGIAGFGQNSHHRRIGLRIRCTRLQNPQPPPMGILQQSLQMFPPWSSAFSQRQPSSTQIRPSDQHLARTGTKILTPQWWEQRSQYCPGSSSTICNNNNSNIDKNKDKDKKPRQKRQRRSKTRPVEERLYSFQMGQEKHLGLSFPELITMAHTLRHLQGSALVECPDGDAATVQKTLEKTDLYKARPIDDRHLLLWAYEPIYYVFQRGRKTESFQDLSEVIDSVNKRSTFLRRRDLLVRIKSMRGWHDNDVVPFRNRGWAVTWRGEQDVELRKRAPQRLDFTAATATTQVHRTAPAYPAASAHRNTPAYPTRLSLDYTPQKRSLPVLSISSQLEPSFTKRSPPPYFCESKKGEALHLRNMPEVLQWTADTFLTSDPNDVAKIKCRANFLESMAFHIRRQGLWDVQMQKTKEAELILHRLSLNRFVVIDGKEKIFTSDDLPRLILFLQFNLRGNFQCYLVLCQAEEKMLPLLIHINETGYAKAAWAKEKYGPEYRNVLLVKGLGPAASVAVDNRAEVKPIPKDWLFLGSAAGDEFSDRKIPAFPEKRPSKDPWLQLGSPDRKP